MNKRIVTKHAQKRVERDRRTVMSAGEVLELANSPFAVKEDGQLRWVYSEQDERTLTIVTGKQGSVLITVYGTERHPNRLVDMVCRARAGLDVPFAETKTPESYKYKDVVEICIGEFDTKRDGRARVYPDLYVVSCFGVSKADHTVLESQWVHKCIVEAVKQGCAEGLFSKNKRKHLKTLFLLDDATFGVLPTWVSFDLLKEKYPP
jgi:hypothetical protein